MLGKPYVLPAASSTVLLNRFLVLFDMRGLGRDLKAVLRHVPERQLEVHVRHKKRVDDTTIADADGHPILAKQVRHIDHVGAGE